MAFDYWNRRNSFRVGKSPEGGVNDEEKGKYLVRTEKALIATLCLSIIFFNLFRRIPDRRIPRWRPGIGTIASIEMVPATRRGALRRPPNLPVVPIPSEDEYLPEDETIETTELDLLEAIPLFDGSGDGSIMGGGMGPRPIREVIPEYPKAEQRRGVEGIIELSILVNRQGYVDSVKVVSNSTSSQVLEQAAIHAALRSQYVPAKRDGEKVARWIRRPYRFERKK